MTNPQSLTVQQKILIAAAELERAGKVTFTAQDITVAAWTRFPDTFSLKGYSGHLDHHAVYWVLCGAKGLAGKRKWLTKNGVTYSLTDTGRKTAENALRPKSADECAMERFLRRIMSCKAVEYFLAERKSEITFAQAALFWEWRKNRNIDVRIEDTAKMLRKLSMAIDDDDPAAGDVRCLGHVHDFLKTRYEHHIKTLRNRDQQKVAS